MYTTDPAFNWYLSFPGLEPREAAKQFVMEYLNGDMKYLTEQKPGETIFDCVTGKSFSEALILASTNLEGE